MDKGQGGSEVLVGMVRFRVKSWGKDGSRMCVSVYLCAFWYVDCWLWDPVARDTPIRSDHERQFDHFSLDFTFHHITIHLVLFLFVFSHYNNRKSFKSHVISFKLELYGYYCALLVYLSVLFTCAGVSAGGIQCGTDSVVSNATYEPSLLSGAHILTTTWNPSYTGWPDLPPSGVIIE